MWALPHSLKGPLNAALFLVSEYVEEKEATEKQGFRSGSIEDKRVST